MFISIEKRMIQAFCCFLLAGLAACFLLYSGGNEERQVLSPQKTEMPAVVIDAGHGGSDGGAVSSAGIEEAEINLAIAGKLNDVLCFVGVTTAMTRTEDVSLHDETAQTVRDQKTSDLKNRAATVNRFPKAVLISIHQNSLPSVPSVRGAQAFFSPGDESERLGESIQAIFNQHINTHRHKQAKKIDSNLYLFSHISNPAVLAECGFLSNGEEAVRLTDSVYQQKTALMIAVGYLQWRSGEGQNDA